MWRYYDEGKSSPFGDNVKIKIDDFKKRYKDDGSCFVWTFEKKSLWDFLYPNVLPKNRKPDLPDYFPCMSHEESYFGGFPVRKAMTWHTGIHVDGFMKPVHSIGPGQLVAARIRDTAPDGEIQLNGSRCFVLIKHQIVMDDEVKEFFSLFYHLWPIYDGEEMLNEFPQERRENCPPWLRQLYSRCYNRAVTWKMSQFTELMMTVE